MGFIKQFLLKMTDVRMMFASVTPPVERQTCGFRQLEMTVNYLQDSGPNG